MRARALSMIFAILVLFVSAVGSEAIAARSKSAPRIDMQALRDVGGRLALVWHGALYLADARSGRVRKVPLPSAVDEMRWAADGSSLSLRSGEAIWSVRPRDAVLHRAPPSCPPPNSLCNAAASPDGALWAYAKTLPYSDPVARSDALFIAHHDRKPAQRYVAHGAGIILAGWSRNSGLLFWLDPMHSASLAADGLPLMTLPIAQNATARPRTVTTMLPYHDWLAWDPSHRLVLLVAGGPRIAWHGKALERCDTVDVRCVSILNERGSVSLDPAWSADGRVAFVRANDLGDGWGFSAPEGFAAWVASRKLWTANADGSNAQRLDAAGRGIYAPAWSTKGRLVYVRDATLWSLRPGDRSPVRIAGPFANAPDPMGMYGYIAWSALYAWSPR
ncbi:MAG: hypothetical protein JO060_04945 [Candidatus Eremiobacteraeota bacterium]|nr:hypothetical protein [Candidatus Eremiobacteraeota bacterium]